MSRPAPLEYLRGAGSDRPAEKSTAMSVAWGNIKHAEFAMASGEMKPAEFTDFLRVVFENQAKFSMSGCE